MPKPASDWVGKSRVLSDASQLSPPIYDASISWSYYLARPFNLFEASIWQEWYVSSAFNEIFGTKWTSGLFIEYPKGIARQYREKDKLLNFYYVVEKLAGDPKKLEKMLNEGLKLNIRAERLLKQNTFTSLESAVEFSARLLHFAATVPYFTGDKILAAATTNPALQEKVAKLRAVSLYPALLEKIISPMAYTKLEELEIKRKNAHTAVTYSELLCGEVENLPKRLPIIQKGSAFVFQTINGSETISFVDNPALIIDKIEGKQPTEQWKVEGISASPGFARGKVCLVLGNDVRNVDISQGNILVAISTNPAILPLLKKAAAIVTEEGGLTSHAAIVAREFGIPCIIGAKNATKIFKDGDEVEVNANKGVVKKV